MTEDELRQHSIALEDVQRTHLGLTINEEMEMSAESVAAMLQSIADEVSLAKAIKIRSVVRALLGQDQGYRLELRQVKRGKHKLAHDFAAEREQNQRWLEELAAYERQGLKTEAGVAAIAEHWQVSRASVFAGIKSAESILELFRSFSQFLGEDPVDHDNPRPAKSRKG